MIAVFTMTRDRLEFTKHCFKLLEEKAGHDYVHYVLDNGSTDGTQEWLKRYVAKSKCEVRHILCKENIGIPAAMNHLRQEIRKRTDVPFVIKMDNDCEIITDNLLAHIARVYNKQPIWNGKWCLSPKVGGIIRQPQRQRTTGWAGYKIGVTDIIGGLFRVVPFDVFCAYEANETLPKARGTDGHFANWFLNQGGTMGYLEEMHVNHYLTTAGQANKYPEYFKRKRKEEGR